MSRLLAPSGYPTAVVVLLMGVLSAIFALNTVDLAKLTLECLQMIRRGGFMGIMTDGLYQLLILFVQATGSLLCYLGFKALEHVLMDRWFRR